MEREEKKKAGKLLRAFRSIDKIARGIKNNTFKKDHIEAVAKLRQESCDICKHFDKRGIHCLVPRTQPCCAECGCSLKFKLRELSSECPIGKWRSLMTEEAEELLKEQIGYED